MPGRFPARHFSTPPQPAFGQVNPGLLRPIHAITMLLPGVVLAIVNFIVER